MLKLWRKLFSRRRLGRYSDLQAVGNRWGIRNLRQP